MRDGEQELRGGDPRMLTDEESNACFKEAGERGCREPSWRKPALLSIRLRGRIGGSGIC